MSLEAGTFVQDLQQANPPGTDKKKQGDDHLRLIKSVLKSTFPNATRAQYFRRARAVSSSGGIAAADMASLIVVDATGGAINLALPSLGASDDGWFVHVVKADASANVVTVTGTINGATNMATGTQYRMMVFQWSGTAWFGTFTINSQAPVSTNLLLDDAVTNAKMADNSVNTNELINLAVTSGKLADNSVLTAKINDLAVTNQKLAGPRMTFQPMTSVGASQTYNTPANCKSVLFWAVGSGGGGGAANTNNGADGGDTTFNGVVAKGGKGAPPASNNSAAGGTGGSGSATIRFPGSSGSNGQNGADFNVAGSPGAPGIWGLGAGQGTTGGGGAGANGTGAGGAGGAGNNTGGGGGAGEQFLLLIQNPAATYTFTITAGGNGGAAGGQAGGNGGNGGVYAFEFY